MIWEWFTVTSLFHVSSHHCCCFCWICHVFVYLDRTFVPSSQRDYLGCGWCGRQECRWRLCSHCMEAGFRKANKKCHSELLHPILLNQLRCFFDSLDSTESLWHYDQVEWTPISRLKGRRPKPLSNLGVPVSKLFGERGWTYDQSNEIMNIQVLMIYGVIMLSCCLMFLWCFLHVFGDISQIWAVPNMKSATKIDKNYFLFKAPPVFAANSVNVGGKGPHNLEMRISPKSSKIQHCFLWWFFIRLYWKKSRLTSWYFVKYPSICRGFIHPRISSINSICSYLRYLPLLDSFSARDLVLCPSRFQPTSLEITRGEKILKMSKAFDFRKMAILEWRMYFPWHHQRARINLLDICWEVSGLFFCIFQR